MPFTFTQESGFFTGKPIVTKDFPATVRYGAALVVDPNAVPDEFTPEGKQRFLPYVDAVLFHLSVSKPESADECTVVLKSLAIALLPLEKILEVQKTVQESLSILNELIQSEESYITKQTISSMLINVMPYSSRRRVQDPWSLQEALSGTTLHGLCLSQFRAQSSQPVIDTTNIWGVFRMPGSFDGRNDLALTDATPETIQALLTGCQEGLQKRRVVREALCSIQPFYNKVKEAVSALKEIRSQVEKMQPVYQKKEAAEAKKAAKKAPPEKLSPEYLALLAALEASDDESSNSKSVKKGDKKNNKPAQKKAVVTTKTNDPKTLTAETAPAAKDSASVASSASVQPAPPKAKQTATPPKTTQSSSSSAVTQHPVGYLVGARLFNIAKHVAAKVVQTVVGSVGPKKKDKGKKAASVNDEVPSTQATASVDNSHPALDTLSPTLMLSDATSGSSSSSSTSSPHSEKNYFFDAPQKQQNNSLIDPYAQQMAYFDAWQAELAYVWQMYHQAQQTQMSHLQSVERSSIFQLYADWLAHFKMMRAGFSAYNIQNIQQHLALNAQTKFIYFQAKDACTEKLRALWHSYQNGFADNRELAGLFYHIALLGLQAMGAREHVMFNRLDHAEKILLKTVNWTREVTLSVPHLADLNGTGPIYHYWRMVLMNVIPVVKILIDETMNLAVRYAKEAEKQHGAEQVNSASARAARAPLVSAEAALQDLKGVLIEKLRSPSRVPMCTNRR